MPLLRNGHIIDDNPWQRVHDKVPLPLDDESGLPTQGPVVVSLQRFLTLHQHSTTSVSGVYLNAQDDVSLLAEQLHRIQLIVIDFTEHNDGCGYSQARTLREQYHFSGELRASGDVRTDQLPFMARAGIDAFEFENTPDERQVRQMLTRLRTSYQPSYELSVAG